MVGDLINKYNLQYQKAKLRPEFKKTVQKRTDLILEHQEMYFKIAQIVKIPAILIACIHNEESGSDIGKFKTALHNGQKIIGTGQLTTIDPIGKGPFNTFEDAAVDALASEIMKFKGFRCTTGAMLEFGERFNGMGYYNRGVVNPYLWAMTDQYTSGYYVKDHVYDPNKVSENYGMAAIFLELGLKWEEYAFLEFGTEE